MTSRSSFARVLLTVCATSELGWLRSYPLWSHSNSNASSSSIGTLLMLGPTTRAICVAHTLLLVAVVALELIAHLSILPRHQSLVTPLLDLWRYRRNTSRPPILFVLHVLWNFSPHDGHRPNQPPPRSGRSFTIRLATLIGAPLRPPFAVVVPPSRRASQSTHLLGHR